MDKMLLRRGLVICGMKTRLDYAYFPTEAVVSLVGETEDGLTVEIGMVGREGFVGLSLLFGRPVQLYRAVVQHQGDAWRVPTQALKQALQERPSLRDELLIYSQFRSAQFAQAAICHRFHSLRQRLSRWLLSLHDRVESRRFPLTHEVMAEMLGGRRPSVGTIVNGLEKEGLIEYQRGSLTILDRGRLERMACECYRVLRQEIQDFVGPGR